MSFARDKVFEVLADGEWHPVEDAIAALMPLMAPGPAYRRAERHRANSSRRRGTQVTPRPDEDREAAIAAGQRTGARNVLRSLRSRNRIEQRTVDGVAQVRITPQGG